MENTMIETTDINLMNAYVGELITFSRNLMEELVLARTHLSLATTKIETLEQNITALQEDAMKAVVEQKRAVV